MDQKQMPETAGPTLEEGGVGDMHRFISTEGDVGHREGGGGGGGDSHGHHPVAESRDFDLFESKLFQTHARTKSDKYERNLVALRWAVSFLVAIVTALMALIVVYGSDYLQRFKYHFTSQILVEGLNNATDHSRANLLGAFAVYAGISLLLCGIAGIMTAAVEPVSLGSGIPEIVMILNGIKVPRAIRFKTLVAKVVGVVFTVGGGLPVGREGPMIHSAAIVGAGMSQGIATSFKCGLCQRTRCCKNLAPFRNDREKRDFITCGVTAGVSAAFGAPIGAVLFALEEGASFWFRGLTWRALFCSMSAIFMLTLIQSFIEYPIADWGKMSVSSGMFNFGSFDAAGQNNGFINAYNVWELPFFIIIGIAGGGIGAGFNAVNEKLTKFRKLKVLSTGGRLLEVLLVALLMAGASFGLTVLFGNCQCLPCKGHPDMNVCQSNCTPYSADLGSEDFVLMQQFTCNSSQYHDLATLYLSPPEITIKELYHFPGQLSISALFVFMLPYIVFTCITNGLHVPGSVFIPSLLFGSALGRIAGETIHICFPNTGHADPGTYALIGSAACLGGISRITISLAVIMIETTGDLQYGLPLVVTLIAAQWFGNVFNDGLYDIKIHLSKNSFIHEDIPRLSHILLASDVMTRRPRTLPVRCRVSDIYNLLLETGHNGFPLVSRKDGKLKGIILRKHLCVLLHLGVFAPNKMTCHLDQPNVDYEAMEEFYPRFPAAKDLELSAEQMDCWVDLSPYLCSEPYVIQQSATLQRTFRLFRTLGLRHLCVVDDNFSVVGIITRHELTEHHFDDCLHEMFNPDLANDLHAPRPGTSSEASSNLGGGATRFHHFIKNLDHSSSYKNRQSKRVDRRALKRRAAAPRRRGPNRSTGHSQGSQGSTGSSYFRGRQRASTGGSSPRNASSSSSSSSSLRMRASLLASEHASALTSAEADLRNRRSAGRANDSYQRGLTTLASIDIDSDVESFQHHSPRTREQSQDVPLSQFEHGVPSSSEAKDDREGQPQDFDPALEESVALSRNVSRLSTTSTSTTVSAAPSPSKAIAF